MKFGVNDVLNFIAIFQLVVLAFMLLMTGGKKISNQLLAIFFIAQILVGIQSIYWYYYMQSMYRFPQLAHIAYPLIFIWGPTMYLYVKSEIFPDFKFSRKLLWHYVPFVLVLVYLIACFHILPSQEKTSLIDDNGSTLHLVEVWLHRIMIAQVFIYNVMGVYQLHKFSSISRNIDLIGPDKVKWVKHILYGYFIACMLHAANTFLPHEMNNQNLPFLIDYVIFFLYYTFVLYRALETSQLGGKVENTKKSRVMEIPKSEADKVSMALDQIMLTEKAYLNFEISLKQLAERLEVRERHLSQVINEYKQQNFYDYINQYRLDEAKALIEKSLDTKKTILQIVYESGFNSKTAFNVAFKKHLGLTPTQYKNSFSAS